MGIKISNNKIHGNRLDGIRIAVGEGIDVEIGHNHIEHNGRHGLNIIEGLDKLHVAGLKTETPVDVLERAYDELSKIKSDSIDEKIKLLEKPEYFKWLERGANIATIASLIIQIFTK